MSDLVSRQDAIDALMNDADWADAIPTIKSLPSSEPTTKCIAQIRIDRDDLQDLVNEKVNEIVDMMSEPKTGKWVDIDNYYRMATCSRCHKVTMFEKWGEYTKPYHYCPNCGAIMKGGGEE